MTDPLFLSITTFIARDLMRPLNYLGQGLMIACIYLVLSMTVKALHKKPPLCPTTLARFLFLIYAVVVVYYTVLSRNSGPSYPIDLQLFSTWGTNNQLHAYMIENILLFLPLGFLLPASYSFFRMTFFCVFTGGFLSAMIELIQYRTGRGICQIDDFLMNLLGTILGFIIFRIFYFIKKKLSNQ